MPFNAVENLEGSCGDQGGHGYVPVSRDLELAQARKGGGGDGDNGKGKGKAEEDAMSSCEGDKTKDGKRICCCCRRNEISVLLIPCRHLCLCSECDKILASCPVFMGDKTVSIGVNVPWK